MNKSVKRIAFSLLTALPACVWSASPIYRCHALNGALLFQDKPCTQVPGTREAKAGKEGEVVPPAPPPAEDAGTANGRYARVIDQAERDRQTQAAADEAEAKRLRAERAAASVLAPTPPPSAPTCRGYGVNGECLDAYYPGYGAYPYPPPPRVPVASPPPAPPPATTDGRRAPISAAEAAENAKRQIMAIP